MTGAVCSPLPCAFLPEWGWLHLIYPFYSSRDDPRPEKPTKQSKSFRKEAIL